MLARDPAQFKAGAKGARNRQPAQQKESRRWLQTVAAGWQAAAALEGSLSPSIGDREAEGYELFLDHQQRRAQSTARHELFMRCQHDRALAHAEDTLFSSLQKQPMAAQWSVAVPRRPGHKARTATLAIRFVQVRFAPPAHPIKYHGQSEANTLWAISAQEAFDEMKRTSPSFKNPPEPNSIFSR